MLIVFVIVMLNFIMLSMLSVIMLSVIMLSDIMLSVIMLSAVSWASGKESLLKEKDQYDWPPRTNYYNQLLLVQKL